LLYSPAALAIDSGGTIYIADGSNYRVRKITNGIISTILTFDEPKGSPTPPSRLAVDLAGNLYINNYGIYKFANGVLTLIAGKGLAAPGDGGPGTGASLYPIDGVAVDRDGKVYVVDSDSIRVLTPAYTPPVPAIGAGAVVNGGSFASGPLAPGSIAGVFGSFGFASPPQPGSAPLPTTLMGMSIQFDEGINAPLFYASPGQANIQIPWELAGQSTVSVRAVLNGIIGPSQNLRLAPFAPGIFTMDASSQGAIVDLYGRVVYSFFPTSAGSIIQIYCTGLGPVENPLASGTAASSTVINQTTTKPTVTIGGVPATVLFSGLAPGTVGEYQVNVQVPTGVLSGAAVPVVLSIGGVTSNTVTIGIR
jgi:uncharacterized protein (TIGR03437 family)